MSMPVQARSQLGAGLSRPNGRAPACHMSAGPASNSGHMQGMLHAL